MITAWRVSAVFSFVTAFTIPASARPSVKAGEKRINEKLPNGLWAHNQESAGDFHFSLKCMILTHLGYVPHRGLALLEAQSAILFGIPAFGCSKFRTCQALHLFMLQCSELICFRFRFRLFSFLECS
jgi:hypothetical protein